MNDTVKILAVDDVAMNLEMLERMLGEGGDNVIKASNGREALELLATNPETDVILLDLEMPVMGGIELLSHLKTDERYREIPVIIITSSKNEAIPTLSHGADDFITRPYNPSELRLRVSHLVRSKKLRDLTCDMNSVLESEVVKKTAQLREALSASRKAELEISLRLGRAAEFRDLETGLHTKRISEFSRQLGALLGLGENECDLLRYSSPLHDVGKIGIPDSILLKPGKLNSAEMIIMKKHTVIGGLILAGSDDLPVITAGRIIALQHHERWDGSGYPYGLSAEGIHLFGRIVMIADVFDALRSKRPYKDSFTLEESLSIMQNDSGTFFDPRVLAVFLANANLFEKIRREFFDECPPLPCQGLLSPDMRRRGGEKT